MFSVVRTVPPLGGCAAACEDGGVRVALVTHASSFEHVPPQGHPERPDRVVAAIEGVEASGLEIVPITAPRVTRGRLLAVHEEPFVDELERFCAAGGGAIDADTYAGPRSYEAACHAAGAGSGAVEALRSGAADTAFIAVRPPGHHADEARSMGFCLFNNIAVTAAQLVAEGERVAIVDWDVHHGNGTQDIFYGSPDVLYTSLHQFPFYPGTGWVDELGRGFGLGTTVNLPMPSGAGGAEYRMAFDRIILPLLQQFDADWVLVSAGYDAHERDPLAGLRLVEADYQWMASALASITKPARTVFFLEGGYDLGAISASVAATLTGAAGTPPSGLTSNDVTSAAFRTMEYAVERLSDFWDVD
jgi:acetoin utilization deacetylase AcuC-like enzyme